MDSQTFVKLSRKAFLPFMTELGFSMAAPSTHTLCYSVDFIHPACVVALSHEPPDPLVHCRIFTRIEGKLSDPEDPQGTLDIAALAARYKPQITQAERIAARKRFSTIPSAEEEHRLMLKTALDLYLALPRHLAAIQAVA